MTWPLFLLRFQKHLTVLLKYMLEIRNIASFIKTCFYWKPGCIKMHKHAETLYTNRGDKLAIVIFIPTLPFSEQKFVEHFPNVIWVKTKPYKPYFWKWITSKLSFIWLKTNSNVFSPWGLDVPTDPFFRQSVFSQVEDPGPDPIFRRCHL